MNHNPSGRPAPVRWIALIAALALLLAQAPAALAAPTVRVKLRASVTLGLVEGRNDTYALSATVKTSDGTAASSAPPRAASRPGARLPCANFRSGG